MKGIEDWSISIEQVYERLALSFQTPGHCFRLPTITTVHAGLPHSRTMVLRDIDDQNFVFFLGKVSCQKYAAKSFSNASFAQYEVDFIHHYQLKRGIF